ncbi:MAG: division/cell wall cluster transcriptional repressor MraZ [Patescibacteria group bacterium]|nr:division/cell wall cluster transcriptional repressor MraZ [Patescibacteria group bacterium]MDD4304672.1 division/cell wall cluster transcriptional repressor MraZ [Patescibacteria group bacterium]MDD4695360.1 division/cell wall cluster transcriptional repressor MraZ [Patescibacteria group bacterium]
MFIGEYNHTIDEKGRLAVPVKFRADFKTGAVVTRGLDNCLFLFTKKSWNELAEKLSKLPISQSKSRAFARLMLAGAMDVKLDTQGRIILPEYLRAYSKLNKKAIVAGVFNRLEIWDENLWNTYKLDVENKSIEIANELGDLGI